MTDGAKPATRKSQAKEAKSVRANNAVPFRLDGVIGNGNADGQLGAMVANKITQLHRVENDAFFVLNHGDSLSFYRTVRKKTRRLHASRRTFSRSSLFPFCRGFADREAG